MVAIVPKRILLVGDLVLDRYVIGSVERISPEAPVPILRPNKVEARPGMVGNVALNLRSLGQEVKLFSRIGADQNGKELKAILESEGIECHLTIDSNISTPVKTRYVCSNQQLLRLDEEQDTPFSCTLPSHLLDDIDLIAISDYQKGFLNEELIQALIDSKIPTVVDPKGREFSRYRNAALIKPNLKEAREASGKEVLDDIAASLFEETRAGALLITRSEEGISLFTPEARQDFPVDVHEVRDVTGAGDTVLAILAAALANNLSLPTAAQLANYGASLAVQHFGCARIKLKEILQCHHAVN